MVSIPHGGMPTLFAGTSIVANAFVLSRQNCMAETMLRLGISWQSVPTVDLNLWFAQTIRREYF
jgi:hypothetical protein